jgi:hypothetical protein
MFTSIRACASESTIIEWENFKSCRVESDRIILKARFLPKIVLPYKEEIYSFIEDKIGNKIRS